MKRKFWNWVRNEGERTLFLNGEISVDISLILGNLITVIVDYQIPHKPLKILSL